MCSMFRLRNSTLFAFAMFISLTFIACNKSGLKDLNVRAPYIKLPTQTLDKSIKTYLVEIDRFNSDGLYIKGTSVNNLLSQVQLNGYKSVNYDADLVVSIGVGAGNFYDKGITSVKRKTKEGKEYYMYKKEIEYSNNAHYRLFSKDRRVLDEVEVMNRNQSQTYSTEEFTTAKACEDWWYKNGNAIIDDLKAEMVKSAFDKIRRDLNEKYGYTETSSYVEFKTIKDKDHRDFRKFESTNRTVETAFKTMSTFSTAEYEKRIMPAIEFWEEQYPKYRSTDEKEQFLRYACLYNITQAYYWMDDYMKAKDFALKMMDEGVNAKEAKRLFDMIENTEETVNRLGYTKQHLYTPAQEGKGGV